MRRYYDAVAARRKNLHGVPPLTPEEAASYHRQAPGWELLDDAKRIARTYRFKNFREAFAFVERAAELAEAEGHHPEIGFGWGFATISLHTKKIKGLHENDFIMAAKLDRIATERTGASPMRRNFLVAASVPVGERIV